MTGSGGSRTAQVAAVAIGVNGIALVDGETRLPVGLLTSSAGAVALGTAIWAALAPPLPELSGGLPGIVDISVEPRAGLWIAFALSIALTATGLKSSRTAGRARRAPSAPAATHPSPVEPFIDPVTGKPVNR